MRKDLERFLPTGPTPAEQEQFWHQHPVLRWDTSLILPYPAMREVARDVLGEICLGRGGHAYVGNSQFGKSTTIRYLMQAIRQLHPHIQVFSLEFEPRPTPSLLSFYSHIVEAIDPNLPLRAKIDDRRHQAVAELLTLALPQAPPTVVFLVDEGQNMDIMLYEWLKYIMERLQKHGVRAMAFVFGQPKLRKVIDQVRSEHADHLQKRFFRAVYALRGVSSVFALKRILQIFDRQATFPRERGWPFSQFYFPQAHAAGWRLTNEALMAWAALTDHPADDPDPQKVEFGSDVIRDMIQYYFTELSRYDGPTWTGTPELWRDAVAASDLGRPA